MKKLFSFLAAAFVAVSVMAQEPTLVLTMANYGVPSEYVNVQTTYGAGDTAITLVPGTDGSGWKMQGNALLFGKNNAELQFTVPFSVGKIIVHGPASGASGKVTFNVFDMSVAEPVAVSAVATGANGDHTFMIDAAHRLPGTTYAIRNTNANNNQIVSIDLFEAVAGAPEAPEFSVVAGTYTSEVSLSLSCPTDGALIHYTLDDSEPTAESAVYDAALTISATTTVKAIAIKDGLASTIVEATYTIVTTEGAGTQENPFTIADVKALNSPATMTEKYWVEGTIIGFYANNKPVPGVEEAAATNLALATGNDTIPVALPSGDVRDALNLADHPENLGAVVKVAGNLQAYFSVAGVKEVTDYEFVTTPSAIKNNATEQKAVKFIENGQVVFIKNGVKYNTLGAKL